MQHRFVTFLFVTVENIVKIPTVSNFDAKSTLFYFERLGVYWDKSLAVPFFCTPVCFSLLPSSTFFHLSHSTCHAFICLEWYICSKLHKIWRSERLLKHPVLRKVPILVKCLMGAVWKLGKPIYFSYKMCLCAAF